MKFVDYIYCWRVQAGADGASGQMGNRPLGLLLIRNFGPILLLIYSGMMTFFVLLNSVILEANSIKISNKKKKKSSELTLLKASPNQAPGSIFYPCPPLHSWFTYSCQYISRVNIYTRNIYLVLWSNVSERPLRGHKGKPNENLRALKQIK